MPVQQNRLVSVKNVMRHLAVCNHGYRFQGKPPGSIHITHFQDTYWREVCVHVSCSIEQEVPQANAQIQATSYFPNVSLSTSSAGTRYSMVVLEDSSSVASPAKYLRISNRMPFCPDSLCFMSNIRMYPVVLDTQGVFQVSHTFGWSINSQCGSSVALIIRTSLKAER